MVMHIGSQHLSNCSAHPFCLSIRSDVKWSGPTAAIQSIYLFSNACFTRPSDSAERKTNYIREFILPQAGPHAQRGRGFPGKARDGSQTAVAVEVARSREQMATTQKDSVGSVNN